MLRLDSISKGFDGVIVLNSVSYEFNAGQVCIVIGPNGAGKTTLLRIMAGLLKPTSGRVVFDKGTQTVGVTLQESFLYSDLTVLENLELYAGLYGVSKGRIEFVSSVLELEGFINHDTATLSHGQRQRASLARAILPDPKIMLLDEPFLGLDAASVGHVQNFLGEFKKQGGLAVVATHELDIVKGVADNFLKL